MSKADLRRAAGLKSPSTLTELENGTRTESPQLPSIAAALGVEVLWLQHDRGPKHRTNQIVSETQPQTRAEMIESIINGMTTDELRETMLKIELRELQAKRGSLGHVPAPEPDRRYTNIPVDKDRRGSPVLYQWRLKEGGDPEQPLPAIDWGKP